MPARVEEVSISHQWQVTKNSIELTWYAVLGPEADYLTSYEVEILSDTSDKPIGHVLNSFIPLRKCLARTVHIPIKTDDDDCEPATEVRGRVRVKGDKSNWSVWCPYKVTKLQ